MPDEILTAAFSVYRVFSAFHVYIDVRYNSIRLYVYRDLNNGPFHKAALHTANQWSRSRFLMSKEKPPETE